MGPAGRERCLARFTIEVVAAQWADVMAEMTVDR